MVANQKVVAVNIALVTHAFSRFGGTEKYVFDLSRWLVSRGHEVYVYCAAVEVPEAHWDGVIVRRLPHLGRRGIVGLSSWLWQSSHLGRDSHDVVQGFGRSVRHDIFRAGGGVHDVWIARRYKRFLDKALLWTSVKGWIDTWVDRAAFNNAEIVICNSKMVAAEVSSVRGIDPAHVRVVRNGVDSTRFKPDLSIRKRVREELQIKEGGRLVLFVGNGFRRKGVMTAGRSFTSVAGPNDRFVVIGKESRYRVYCRDLKKMMGEKLIYIGPVEDTARWLPAADALLLPTVYDPAANVTLEALACGVPPIVSSRDGNHEVLPFPELVVSRPDDDEGFASSLSWVLSKGDVLGKTLRDVALGWPVSRNGERMESIYYEFVNA